MTTAHPDSVDARSSLWTSRQLVVLAVAQVLGAALVGVAWWQSREVEELGDQTAWLNLAVIGLVVSASAIGGWLLVGRRAVGALLAEALPVIAPGPLAAQPRAYRPRDLWVPGTSRVHRAGCQLIAGKAAMAVTEARRKDRGLQDCAICHG